MSFENLENTFATIKTEQFQQQLSEQAEEAMFIDKEAAQNTVKTINHFLDDYLESGKNQPLDQWLVNRFGDYPDIWRDEQEKIDTANMIISTVETLIDNQIAIDQHLNKGKTLANYLNKKIEQVAQKGDLDPQQLAQDINQGLKQANQALTEMYIGEPIELTAETSAQGGLALSQEISKRAEITANLNLMGYGLKSIGTRLWNAIKGEKNLSRAEELTQIIRSSIETIENKGVQVAISGGVVVSAKKGWIKNVFDSVEKIENSIEKTRSYFDKIQNLTLNVANGLNDVRILDAVERGAIMMVDVAQEKAKFMVAQTITKVEKTIDNYIRTKGSAYGAKIGAAMGAIFGPAGATLGSVIGGYVGEKVAELVSDKVIKPLANIARKVATKAIDTVASMAKKAVSVVKTVVRSVKQGIKNLFGF